jgi:hypothetical protein
MINTRKVLILGAGASMPFAFPSGWGLVHDVCTGLQGGQALRRVLEDELKFDSDLLTNFGTSLKSSRQPSVDQFLELRPEFLEVGKAAIAAALIPNEVPSRLDPPQPTWYDYLFNALRCKPEVFRENCLSIVTYNYDRSLDFFLLRSLQSSYGIRPQEARELLSLIPIIHLHGQLGDLQLSEDEPGRPYTTQLTARAVQVAADGIRVVHEEITEAYDRALDCIRAADMICLLGFGYNETNVERLRLSLWPSVSTYGTAYGLTNSEISRIHNERLKGRSFSFGTGQQDVLAFLRHYALLP